MQILSTRQVRADLAAAIDAALVGDTVIIERGNAPVAKIAPLSSRDLGEYRRLRAEGERST